MIKECKVLAYNKHLNILAIEYDSRQIQLTATLADPASKFVFIKCNGNKYEVVSKTDYEKYYNDSKKPKRAKKEPVVNLISKEKIANED